MNTCPKVVLLLILALTWTFPYRARAGDIQPGAIEQIESLVAEKRARTPLQRKIDSALLFALKRARGAAEPAALRQLTPTVVPDAEDRVRVEIRADVTPGLIAEVEARGGLVLGSSPRWRSLRVLLPLEEVEAVAAASEVTFVAPILPPIVNKVDTSEGDVAHAADLARMNLGVDGSGVVVGVISNGVDSLLLRQATGDLPADVTVLPGLAGSGDEGTAMLEIVFDLAPGADLLFATSGDTSASMADSVVALAAAGADVIVDDLTFPSDLVFQDGPLAQTVEEVVADGVVYVSSAGNSGNTTHGTAGVFEGTYTGTSLPLSIPGISAADFGTNGLFNSNLVVADAPYAFTLQWADPAGQSSNDYDLFLLNGDETGVIGFSNNVQSGTQNPIEAIPSPIDHTGAHLVVVKFDGEDRYFHLNTHRGELSQGTPGQIFGHAGAESCLATAAIDFAVAAGGVFPDMLGEVNIESFSSEGPRRVFFEADGTPITPGDFSSTGGELRSKPDLTAADRVSTSTPGFESFPGTSAAAPHVAAIAALMLEAGNLTPFGVRSVFFDTALDMFPPGLDARSGAGIVHAERAVGTVSPAAPSCYVNTLVLFGTLNDGPQTFRACAEVIAGEGTFDDVTLIAHDGVQSGKVTLTSGFSTSKLTIQTQP